VNRVGKEGEMQFWGHSFATNAFGRMLAECSADKEEVAVVSIDLGESDRYRTHWPFLRDRRIDSYAPITRRLLDDDDAVD
ncbi:MAG: acyltransferase, partial [Balneolales bacterium]|nr:acyltransferase [Balneolales bacterium]